MMLVDVFFGAAAALVVALLVVWARRARRASFEERFLALLGDYDKLARSSSEPSAAALLKERLGEIVRERRFERLNSDFAVAFLACLWLFVMVGAGAFIVERLIARAPLTWGDGLRINGYLSVSVALVVVTFALDAHSRRRVAVEEQHRVYRETGRWPEPGEGSLQSSPLLQLVLGWRAELSAAWGGARRWTGGSAKRGVEGSGPEGDDQVADADEGSSAPAPSEASAEAAQGA
ncbi:MAG: hypothetical protein ACRC20_12180 [Segniliparus sp.]|uniref:hypothetical protein n=1 Tax=Segniliparus sp. TaxID=2804064 RepID=UPI003F325AF9